jgi:hypothetical protein
MPTLLQVDTCTDMSLGTRVSGLNRFERQQHIVEPRLTLSAPLHQGRRMHARHVPLQRRGQAPLVRSLAASCACARTASTPRSADKANAIEGGTKQQHVRTNIGAVE